MGRHSKDEGKKQPSLADLKAEVKAEQSKRMACPFGCGATFHTSQTSSFEHHINTCGETLEY